MHSKSVFHTWATNFGLANHEMQAAWEAWDAHERLMHGEYKKLQILYFEELKKNEKLKKQEK
jgi:hypothetical protein